MNDFSDAQLLEQYLSGGSQTAFAELVGRHAGWVYSAALRMVCDPATAEDVTQAVFLAMAQNGRKLGRRSVGGWLFKTTRYLASNAIRARVRREKHERRAAMVNLEASGSAAVGATWKEIAPHLEELVGRLRASEREAVLLRFYQGKSLSEVGGALGISQDAARKRIARAVGKLRRRLARSGVSIPTGAFEALAIANVAHAAPAALVATCASLSVSSAASSLAQGVGAMILKAKLKTAAIAGMAAALPIACSAILLAQAADQPIEQVPTAAAADMTAAAAAAPVAMPAQDPRMDSWWADLAKADPMCDRALLNFAAVPDSTVAFMKTRLLPLTITADRVNQLLADLGSDKAEVWKPADEELRYFDPRLAIDLPTMMERVTSSPARQRLAAVLNDSPPGTFDGMNLTFNTVLTGGYRLDNGQTSWWVEGRLGRLAEPGKSTPKRLWGRAIRAMVILQQIGTPDAKAILKDMAGGNPDAQPTKVAREALAQVH